MLSVSYGIWKVDRSDGAYGDAWGSSDIVHVRGMLDD